MTIPPPVGSSISPTLIDQLGRPLGSLRVSVTDRCNMRCRYCMPEDEYVWLPRASILRFEEIDRLVGIFSRLGVSKILLTGGEPLLRQDLSALVRLISRRPAIQDLALTTNGILLGRHAAELRSAGLRRVTVSLDTLRADRMLAFARTGRHAEVLEGIDVAGQAGFTGLKINTVVIRGFNDDELGDLLEFGRAHDAEVRFIEYMDVGGATDWSISQVVSREEILARLEERYGRVDPVEPGTPSRAPADRFRLPDGRTFGIIASTTAPFCRDCDRARLTADGTLLRCLYAESGLDLREVLRSGATDDGISERIADAWRARRDRGAEERLRQPDRGVLYRLETLRADPRREMHTRGG
jgi:cyclic pyranopterin phosphate synthase